MVSLVLDSPCAQLDSLLELVCVELQLTDTQHADAERSYGAVGEWLDAPNSTLAKYRPRIFPLGSKALGTAVKPRQREEFDVDLASLLQIAWREADPSRVYQMVLERLAENEVYRPMIIQKERCIRLDYAGQFHLDVIPACPAPRPGMPWGELAIVIPDRARRIWVPTNPRGFIRWFFSRAMPAEQHRLAASVEPLPPNVAAQNKTILHRSVQLFKRRRDVHFDGDEFAPRSILLTTISGLSYLGEASLSESVVNILDRVDAAACAHVGSEPPVIANPTDASENLARHWREDQRHFEKFVEYVAVFQDGMRRLREARGMERIARVLNELFDPTGSGVVSRAVRAYADTFQKARSANEIRVPRREPRLTTVAASPAALGVPATRFYGDV